MEIYNQLADGLQMADGDEGLDENEYSKFCNLIKSRLPAFEPPRFIDVTNKEGVIDGDGIQDVCDKIRDLLGRKAARFLSLEVAPAPTAQSGSSFVLCPRRQPEKITPLLRPAECTLP